MKLPRLLLVVVVAVAALASSAWRELRSARDGRWLAERARPGDIRMLSSETCPYCVAARRWLQAEGVPFSECFIERDAACAADYQATGAAGTPTFVVRGQRILGFDRARLIERFSAAGGPGGSSRVGNAGWAALPTRLDGGGKKASFA